MNAEVKSDHRIIWRYEHDMVCTEVVCDAPTPAPCRLTCAHGCEEWTEPFEVNGVWLHDIEGWQGNIIATHEMSDMGYCGFKDWFDEPQECGEGEFVIGEVPITTRWHGDHFTWTKKGGAA